MAFVPAPNVVQVELRYLLFGQKIENRYMVNNLAAVDAGSLQEIAIQGWNWAENTLFPLVSNQMLLREVLATDLTASDGGQYTYAPDNTTIGGMGGAMLPNETAFCVSLRSQSRGRSARGRMFIPGISVSLEQDPNTLTATAAGNFVTAVQTLINDVSADGRDLVIVSYVSGGVPRPGGPVFYSVTTALATDNTLDSQRRRKPGNGS